MFMFNMPLSKPRRAFQVKQKPACKATQGNPQYSNATYTYAFCPLQNPLLSAVAMVFRVKAKNSYELFSVDFKSNSEL